MNQHDPESRIESIGPADPGPPPDAFLDAVGLRRRSRRRKQGAIALAVVLLVVGLPLAILSRPSSPAPEPLRAESGLRAPPGVVSVLSSRAVLDGEEDLDEALARQPTPSPAPPITMNELISRPDA